MAADCCDHRDSSDPHRGNPAYRRVLWAVLAINAVMFAVEIGAGLAAGSAALQADALDFLGDAANYGISLSVVGMALRYRAIAAFAKGATMGVFGLWVTGTILWHAAHGTLPSALTMGAVGFTALAANAAHLACSGPIAGATQICAQRGFVPATTCSAIWRSCWQRLGYSAQVPDGPISSWQRSWQALRCKGH
jgi:hypothetical protein